MDDMDISDSEMSFMLESEAEASDDAYESDLDWVESGKKNIRKPSQTHRTRKSSSDEGGPIAKSSEVSNGESVTKDENSELHPCCSCSRGSFCKTKRCECRALGSVCSAYCGCVSSKCTNREGGEMIDMDGRSNADAAEIGESLDR